MDRSYCCAVWLCACQQKDKTLPVAALLGVETTVFILSALLFNSFHYGKLPEDKFQILLHLSLTALGRSSLMYQTLVHSLSVCSPELPLPFTSLLFGMATIIPTATVPWHFHGCKKLKQEKINNFCKFVSVRYFILNFYNREMCVWKPAWLVYV